MVIFSLDIGCVQPYLRDSTDKFITASTKQVKNPFEENEIVGITNYIDFGFELQTRYSN